MGGGILKYGQREWKLNGKALYVFQLGNHFCQLQLVNTLHLGPGCFFLGCVLVLVRKFFEFQHWIYQSSFQIDIVTQPFRTANLWLRLLGIPTPQHPGTRPNLSRHTLVSLPRLLIFTFMTQTSFLRASFSAAWCLLLLQEARRLGRGRGWGQHSCGIYWHSPLKSKHTTK